MSELFVSYRREDARWAAGRICDWLLAEFGEGRVFFDTIAIEPGEDFVETIGARVEACRIVLAIIGPNWLDILRARLRQPNDYLRIELAQALKRGVRVVPLTIDDAAMPGEADLPDEIVTLARRHAVPVRADTFRSDIAPLVEFLRRALSEAPPAAAQPTAPPRRETTAASLRLKHRTEFWKESPLGGSDLYKIFVWVDAEPAALEAIEKVVYTLHPSFKNPVREILDRENNFQLLTNGWGEFEIQATAYFKNGDPPAAVSHYIDFDRRR
jgi:hypothetical protein